MDNLGLSRFQYVVSELYVEMTLCERLREILRLDIGHQCYFKLRMYHEVLQVMNLEEFVYNK